MSSAATAPAWTRFGTFIRFSHTVFALPFALVAMLAAARGLPELRVVFWILVCMVSARTAAMVFNRLADWEIDQRNPRTSDRHRLVGRRAAQGAFVAALGVFVAAAGFLNTLCLVLAPVAVFLFCFYSFCKRFTPFAHFFLGLALAAAPMGAWAAVTGDLTAWTPWVLALGVLLWVFGFDLIYATLDMDFDRREGLHSFPARFGLAASLRTAAGLHAAAWGAFAVAGVVAGFSWGWAVGCGLSLPLLVWEHRLGRSGDAAAVNRAFFQVNAAVSLLLLFGAAIDVFMVTR